MKTFNVERGLKFGGRLIHTVLVPADATDRQIIEKALSELDSHPGIVCGPNEPPYVHRSRILRSTVTRY